MAVEKGVATNVPAAPQATCIDLTACEDEDDDDVLIIEHCAKEGWGGQAGAVREGGGGVEGGGGGEGIGGGGAGAGGEHIGEGLGGSVEAAAGPRPLAHPMETLSAERQEMVRMMMEATGIDEAELARGFLQDNSWRLEKAVNMYMDATDAGVPPEADAEGDDDCAHPAWVRA